MEPARLDSDADRPAAATSARGRSVVVDTLALALGAAIALGLARFSYALLIGPMRDALGWSFFAAGALNTSNAVGYLAGALLAPRLIDRVGARAAFVGGSLAAALVLALHAVAPGRAAAAAAIAAGAATMIPGDAFLHVVRFATGVASAVAFVAGGLLAARLGTAPPPTSGRAMTAGAVLGLYYGGTGLGIVASALLLPDVVARAGWRAGWLALGAAALAAAVTIAVRLRTAGAWLAPPAPAVPASAARGPGAPDAAPPLWRPMAPALAGYFMFGLGYIGYMTFVVALLRAQGLGAGRVVAFYALLGAAVVASPFVWAGLLQRRRDGGALTRLNALLALATALPLAGAVAPAAAAPAAFASGLLFGGVFLSLVASTTAFVRHNLPAAAWPRGIGAFTAVFAAGQIIGPALVGRLADGAAGLAGGFALSAAALALGAALAARQRALPAPSAG